MLARERPDTLPPTISTVNTISVSFSEYDLKEKERKHFDAGQEHLISFLDIFEEGQTV
jgi:hypothetical protein